MSGSTIHRTEKRQPGSTGAWSDERPPWRGVLRIDRRVIWRCWHDHTTRKEARACASEHLRNNPGVGR